MLQPKLTLSWEGYQGNICNGLGTFQQNEDFVDMTLAADGHFVKVHQLIISLVSPYLKELIKSAQCQHPVIFLNKISYQTLCSVLEYVYTGEVTVAKENLDELVEAAKELRIKGLDNMSSSITTVDVPPPPVSITKTTREHSEHDLNMTHSDHETYANDDADDTMITDSQDEPIKKDLTLSLQDTGRINMHIGKTRIIKEREKANTSLTDVTSSPSIQYTISNQGNLQVIVNRFIYHLRYKRKSKTTECSRTWRCVDYNSLRCPASVITRGNMVIDRTSAHNHAFHDNKIAKKVMLNAVFSAIMEAEEKGDSLKQNSSKKNNTVT